VQGRARTLWQAIGAESLITRRLRMYVYRVDPTAGRPSFAVAF
jgi:hypothetical protein